MNIEQCTVVQIELYGLFLKIKYTTNKDVDTNSTRGVIRKPYGQRRGVSQKVCQKSIGAGAGVGGRSRGGGVCDQFTQNILCLCSAENYSQRLLKCDS